MTLLLLRLRFLQLPSLFLHCFGRHVDVHKKALLLSPWCISSQLTSTRLSPPTLGPAGPRLGATSCSLASTSATPETVCRFSSPSMSFRNFTVFSPSRFSSSSSSAFRFVLFCCRRLFVHSFDVRWGYRLVSLPVVHSASDCAVLLGCETAYIGKMTSRSHSACANNTDNQSRA